MRAWYCCVLLAACNQILGLSNVDPRTKDSDGDGIPDEEDNCPGVANPDQSDIDGDGIGDVCDGCPTRAGRVDSPDEDGDGVLDSCDNCPGTSNVDQPDRDGDGIGDACDLADTPQTRRLFDGFNPMGTEWDAPWPDDAGTLTPGALPSTMQLQGITLANVAPKAWHVDIGLRLTPHQTTTSKFLVVLHDPNVPSTMFDHDELCGIYIGNDGLMPWVGVANTVLGTGAMLPADQDLTLRLSLVTIGGQLGLRCTFGGIDFDLMAPYPSDLAELQLSIRAEFAESVTYIDVVE